MNFEAPYLDEGFIYSLGLYFDIMIAQLGVITRTRNKFVEIAAVAECYLIITHVKNKESKKQPFQIYLPVNLANGRETFLRT